MISKIMLILKTLKRQKTRMLFNVISFIIVMFSLNFIICTIYSIIEAKNLIKESEESKVLLVDFDKGPSYQKESQVNITIDSFNQLELEFFTGSHIESEVVPRYSNNTNSMRYSILSNCKNIQDNKLKIFVVDPGYFNLFQIRLIQGRVYEVDDVKQSQFVVINKHVYEKLKSDIHQNVLKIGQEEYQVIGVVDDDNKGYHFSMRGLKENYDTLYVTPPLGVYRQEMDGFFVKPLSKPMSPVITQLLVDYQEKFNRKGVQIKPYIEGVSEVVNEISYGAVILFVFSIVLLICSELGLFGTVQIFNKERSRDYCIKMVYGCTDRDIFFEVLFEFMLISFAGTTLGVILSTVLIYEVNTVLNPPITIMNNLWINVVLILLVNGLSLALAIFPAYSGTKNRPVDILREL